MKKQKTTENSPARLTVDDLRRLYLEMQQAMPAIEAILEKEDVDWVLLKHKLSIYQADLNKLDVILKVNLDLFDASASKESVRNLMSLLSRNRMQVQQMMNTCSL